MAFRRCLPGLIIPLSLLLCMVAAPVYAVPTPEPSTFEGFVVGVSEGDRITVNSFGTEIVVRLYGIAAPQTAKVDRFTGLYRMGQPYADNAFRALSLKVLHQQVKVEIRRTLVFKDDHNKQMALAVVFLDGRNINLEMVADGWAWVYKKFLDRIDYHLYSMAERRARTRKAGLWLQEDPVPPWEYQPRMKGRIPVPVN